MNPMDLKRGIDASVKVVMEDLDARAKMISSPEEIKNVATIASNGDTVIGGLIANAFEKVGKDGTITVSDGKTLDHELEIVEGMRFDRGYISPYFVTDNKTLKVEMENPMMLFFEKRISSIQSLMPVLEQVARLQKPLLIVAEDIEGEALATLVVNKLRGGLKVAAVKAPGFGDDRKAQLEDMAVLLNAEMMSEETGGKLEDLEVAHLGSAKTVTITKDETVILDGEGDRSLIEERCDNIREAIENSSSEYLADKMKERLAKLGGGVAVIKVGGASEVEVG